MKEKEWCLQCGRPVAAGKEHDFQAHGGNAQSAADLKKWREALRKSGEHR
jgi:hypothetical protein